MSFDVRKKNWTSPDRVNPPPTNYCAYPKPEYHATRSEQKASPLYMIVSTLDPSVQAALIGAGGIAVGTCIAAFFNSLMAKSTRESEERRVIYDIASKIAMEQWKLDVETIKARNEDIKVPNDQIGLFRLDIPRVADTVKDVMGQLQSITRRKSTCVRLCEWQSSKKKK